MDVMLPPWVCVARARMNYVDSTGVSRSEFTGQARTASKGGDRLSASLELGPTITTTTETERQRAALIAFLVKLRGRQNRAYLYDRANRIRGSFPIGELLINNTFEDGTTGWSAVAATLSVADRTLRVSGNGSTASAPRAYQDVVITPNVPYVVRGMLTPGASGSSLLVQALDSVNGITSTLKSGLISQAIVPVTSPLTARYGDSDPSQVGKYFLLSYTSVSRCALVDNGPNLLTQSGNLGDTGSWTRNGLSSVGTGIAGAPDGSSTVQQIAEDGTAFQHGVVQTYTSSSAAADYSAAFIVKQSSRSWIYIDIDDNTNHSRAWFNLGTGAIGTVNASTGFTNPRAFIKPLGNGWYYCSLVVRKTSSSTTMHFGVAAATSNGNVDYTGTSPNVAFEHWRGGAAVSSVPFRAVLTTSVPASGSNQSGSALYVKGLPASTDGLLLETDQFEVITSYGSELKFVTAALNSDSVGMGYLQFEPPLRGVPADNAPIIVYQPMMRALFTGELVGWENEPGVVTRASAEFEEA